MHSKAFVILVVDDVATNVMILQSFLENEGYRVVAAGNGLECRELARREPPDLILLDVMMPEEDGFTACEKLKQDPRTADIPIIFISANTDTESKVRGLSIGGWDYIAKPFERMEVLARVKNCLKLRLSYQRIIEEQARRLQQVQDAQQALLVDAAELPAAGFTVHYIPVQEAGGDFYDVFEISPGVFGYFVADISGHDLGASFASSALKALIRQNSSQLFAPEETIRMINRILSSFFSDGQHLTAIYATLDRGRSRLTMVNAAHLPLLFLPVGGNPVWFEANGDIIGAFESGYFASRLVPVTAGDRFFLFTDGLVEIFGGPRRSREEGLAELQAEAQKSRALPLAEASAVMLAAMRARHDSGPEDDILLLGVEV